MSEVDTQHHMLHTLSLSAQITVIVIVMLSSS